MLSTVCSPSLIRFIFTFTNYQLQIQQESNIIASLPKSFLYYANTFVVVDVSDVKVSLGKTDVQTIPSENFSRKYPK